MRQANRSARQEFATSKSATVIHRGTFEKQHGMTPKEMHRRLAWPGAFCYVCNSRDVVVQLAYSMSAEDLVAREPRIAAAQVDPETGKLPVWRSKYGALVKFAVEYACRKCSKQVQIDAAKLPSHILVEIDHGPDEKVSVQVPGAAP